MNHRPLAACLLMFALGCQKQADPAAPAPETKSANGSHDRSEGKGDGKSKTASVAFPPADWSVDDLAKYLSQKGIPVNVRPNPQNNLADRTAFNLYTGTETEPCVLVYHCRDAALAKDTAAALGADAFATGRFALGYLPGFQSAGSKQLLAKVKDGIR
ncbi:hypothetical protein [Frigoriglobus tundricola]|uniref:Rhodanese domain-containing protein n=1 Tax=Frigoriglobus tundricola TaxID=2774151 RepID=A0A6M5Z285_9BACT|nr:hypothetical protein [Frigoriglobus tundricola]QJX00166.1 hypothetical protein FTUN_7790 [Frigoriglobus tundricola]